MERDEAITWAMNVQPFVGGFVGYAAAALTATPISTGVVAGVLLGFVANAAVLAAFGLPDPRYYRPN